MKKPDRVLSKFNLHAGGGIESGGMVQVHIERKKFSLGEQLRRAAMPVQFAGMDFAGGGQLLDGCADGGKTSVVKKPDDRRGGNQRDDELHEQSRPERGAGERRHAARRQRFPGEGWSGRRIHRATDFSADLNTDFCQRQFACFQKRIRVHLCFICG